jgi:hypothetical protein
MEDHLMEINDHETEKEQKKENKKSQEESLVAGGKLLRDKAAQQIVTGTTVAVGGAKASLTTFQASPSSRYLIWKHQLNALPLAARSGMHLNIVQLKWICWSTRTKKWSWS